MNSSKTQGNFDAELKRLSDGTATRSAMSSVCVPPVGAIQVGNASPPTSSIASSPSSGSWEITSMKTPVVTTATSAGCSMKSITMTKKSHDATRFLAGKKADIKDIRSAKAPGKVTTPLYKMDDVPRIDVASPDDSDPESDYEKHARDRSQVKPFVIDPLPTAENTIMWHSGLLVKAQAASNRMRTRTMKFMTKIINANDLIELEDLSGRREKFHLEPQAAVKVVVDADITRQIML